MKKICVIYFTVMALVFSSCNNSTGTPAKPTDSSGSTGSNSPDSAANNGILPPSAAPGNATNSSLADSTYKTKDSLKSKKP